MAYQILQSLNLPRMLCEHVIGEKHSHAHRMICGALVMLMGVMIAKQAHAHTMGLDVLVDMFGYLVHGVGAVPYVDAAVLAFGGKPLK